MAEQKETLSERLIKLRDNIEQKAQKKKAFTKEAMEEFYRGFDHPIIGSLEYLKQHITYYETLNCHVTGDLINGFSITGNNTYQQLLDELMKIQPKARLDFTFTLSGGIFQFLNNIQECVSVYFSQDNYMIDYVFEDAQHLTFEKEYETHITPEEIVALRDRIAESIFQKISAQFDANA